MSFAKQKTWRSREWLELVHRVPCVHCGSPEVQAAHANRGKGGAIKASDATVAALCMTKHMEVDSGTSMTRDQRRRFLDYALVATMGQLIASRYVSFPTEYVQPRDFHAMASQAIEADEYGDAAEWVQTMIETEAIVPNRSRLI